MVKRKARGEKISLARGKNDLDSDFALGRAFYASDDRYQPERAATRGGLFLWPLHARLPAAKAAGGYRRPARGPGALAALGASRPVVPAYCRPHAELPQARPRHLRFPGF